MSTPSKRVCQKDAWVNGDGSGNGKCASGAVWCLIWSWWRQKLGLNSMELSCVEVQSLLVPQFFLSCGEQVLCFQKYFWKIVFPTPLWCRPCSTARSNVCISYNVGQANLLFGMSSLLTFLTWWPDRVRKYFLAVQFAVYSLLLRLSSVIHFWIWSHWQRLGSRNKLLSKDSVC